MKRAQSIYQKECAKRMLKAAISESCQFLKSECFPGASKHRAAIANLQKKLLCAQHAACLALDSENVEDCEDGCFVDTCEIIHQVLKETKLSPYVKTEIGRLPTLFINPTRIRTLFSCILSSFYAASNGHKPTIRFSCCKRGSHWRFTALLDGKVHRSVRPAKQMNAYDLHAEISFSTAERIVEFYEGKLWRKSSRAEQLEVNFTLPLYKLSQAQ